MLSIVGICVGSTVGSVEVVVESSFESVRRSVTSEKGYCIKGLLSF